MNMNRLQFVLISIICSFPLFAQKNISGSYLNTETMEIKIKNDQFYFIISQSHSPIYANDTLAKCSFKWIDDQFIELNSTPPYVIAQQGIKVFQSFDSTVEDSVRISFSIPYRRSNLDIYVFTNTFKTFGLSYSRDNRGLMLPGNTKAITFSISPEEYLPAHSVDGSYYGVLYYSSMEYTIDKNINCIDISIPAIDDSFFEKYYVKGEYAKVSKDSITWKGEVFVKEK